MGNMFQNIFGKNEEETEDMQQSNELIDKLLHRISSLEKRVGSLEQQVEMLKTQPTTDEQPDEGIKMDVVTETDTITIDMTPREPQPTLYYMSAPELDGTFSRVALQEQAGKTIFQLTTTDGQHGTFIVMDTPDAIATAVISISQFLKPVCRVAGDSSIYPNHILTDEEGLAVREGNSWKVTQKAIIHFE